MAKKTYRTYHLKGLQILLSDESGRTIEVNFKGGLQFDSTAKFSTTDEKVQEALEKCSGFKRDFYLDSVREDSPVKAESGERKAESKKETENGERRTENVVKVADKADAIEWLKENHPDKGYTANKLRSEAAFTAACQECGVTFEFVG